MSEYYVNLLNAAGALQAVITDFTGLSYARKVNHAGMLQLALRGDHPILASLADRWQVEVWRKSDGGSFGRDFVGVYRQGEYYYGAEGSQAVLTFPGILSLLGERIVAWKAATANRSQFTGVAAETILKTLVSYNAGSAATTGNGRIRNGAISGMTLEADGAHGAALDWYCAYENLLETMQKLAQIAGGDFDLIKTGAATWQFRWYTGQRGTDRTAEAAFSLGRGNMANPTYKTLRIGERTAAIVGGKGENADRAVAVRTGAGYSASNDVEVFVNATNVDTTDGLNDRGDAALIEKRAQEQFAFEVLQTPGSQYGVHYGLGDLVTAINPFTGQALAVKINECAVTLDQDGAEKIAIRLGVE